MQDRNVSSRERWMDLMRGTAIVLVICWHAQAIPALHGYGVPGWVVALNTFFLPFRMPVLMLLSGILLERSLKKDRRRYYLGKIRLVAWPYFVWAGIFLVFFGSPGAVYDPRAWIATDYLWFIFFLLCYYLVAPIVARLPPWLTPVAMSLSSIPLDIETDGLTKRFLYMGAYFFGGYFISLHRRRFARLGHRPALVTVTAVAGVAAGIASATVGIEHQGQYAPLVTCGIFAACVLAKKIEGSPLMEPLRYIGRHSIAFYVSHFPVIMTVVNLTGASWAVHPLIWLGFALALAFGFALAEFRAWGPVRWLFQPPHL